MELAIDRYPSSDEAAEAMAEAGGFLAEDIAEALGKLLPAADLGHLAPLLTMAWFVFVPPGHFGPDIFPEEIGDMYGKKLASFRGELEKSDDPEKNIAGLLGHGLQPNLVRVLTGQFMLAIAELPKEQQPPPERAVLQILMLKAVVEVLDKKCREDVPDDEK